MSSRFTRKQNTKTPNRVIRIYTEGKKTEPNYFKAIRDEMHIPGIEIVIHGCADHTLPLVEQVIERKEGVRKTDEETEWWVVFDRDGFEDFNRAVALAKGNDINVAYSNECFELWYILHFEYLTTSIGRKKYNKKLGDLLGERYQKNSVNIYERIKDKEATAVRNAKKLEAEHTKEGAVTPEMRDPSTTVHLLVGRIRELGAEH